MNPTSMQLTKRYKWLMQDGTLVSPKDMATSHLFYTVRMIFNHSVPASKQIPGCKRWTLRLSPDSRREALEHMIRELSTRSDIQPWQWDQLRHMRDNTDSAKLVTV